VAEFGGPLRCLPNHKVLGAAVEWVGMLLTAMTEGRSFA